MNDPKEFYISSDIDGIHTPMHGTIELAEADLYILMETFAKQYLQSHDSFIDDDIKV